MHYYKIIKYFIIYHYLVGYILKSLTATREVKSRAHLNRKEQKPLLEVWQPCSLQGRLAGCSPLAARSMVPARCYIQRSASQQITRLRENLFAHQMLGFSTKVSPKDTSCDCTGYSVQLSSLNRKHKFKKNFKVTLDMNLVHRLEIALPKS